MPKKTKTKEIKLPMEFNPGTEKYEPRLPVRKTKENVKKRIDNKFDLIIIIILIIFGLSLFVYSLISLLSN
jgi:uncharacterized membrane protein